MNGLEAVAQILLVTEAHTNATMAEQEHAKRLGATTTARQHQRYREPSRPEVESTLEVSGRTSHDAAPADRDNAHAPTVASTQTINNYIDGRRRTTREAGRCTGGDISRSLHRHCAMVR